MEEVVLLQENHVVGSVRAETVGAYLKVSAECRKALCGICRAYLVCDEREWLIGVLVPNDDGVFSACVRIPKHEKADLDSCVGRIRSSGESAWVFCDTPQSVFSDAALCASMLGASGVLVDCAEHPRRVAVPLENGCACAPALCLAQLMRYQGKDWAVLGVDENGRVCSCGNPNDSKNDKPMRCNG